MAKKKAPFFKMYPSDLISDPEVSAMTNAQLGGYIKLLCYQWMNADCWIPFDHVSRLSGLRGNSLQLVLQRFSIVESEQVQAAHHTTKYVRQERLYSEWCKMKNISEKRSSAANQRHHGSDSGDANAHQLHENSMTEVRGQSTEVRDYSLLSEELRTNSSIRETITRIVRASGYVHFDAEKFSAFVEIFIDEITIDQPLHNNFQEGVSHFKNWTKEQLRKHSKRTTNAGRSSQQRGSRLDAILG